MSDAGIDPQLARFVHSLQPIGEAHAVARPDQIVVAAVQQQKRWFVAVDKVDRLRIRVALRGTEYLRDVGVGDRQEIVWPRDRDDARQVARRETLRVEIACIGAQQRGDMRAG